MVVELRGRTVEGIKVPEREKKNINVKGVEIQWEKGEWEFIHPELGVVKKPTFSILNPDHWDELSDRLSSGEVAAGMMMGVFGVFKKLDSSDSATVLFERVKKRPTDQNLVALAHPSDIQDVIDYERLKEPFKSSFRASEERLRLFAGPQHVILPIKAGTVNEALIRKADQTMACFWVPGHYGFEGLINAAKQKINGEMLGGGSLNFHGQEPCYDKKQLHEEMSRKPEWLEEIDFVVFDDITENEDIGRSHTMVRYTGDKPEIIRLGSLGMGKISRFTGHDIVLAEDVKYASSKRDYTSQSNLIIEQRVERAIRTVQSFRTSFN